MLKINVFELINVLLVIFLFFILTRKRDIATLLIVLFVYGTLHFSFAAIVLATNESLGLLAALHNKGGGVLAKLSNLLLLGVIFVLLSVHAYHAFWLSQRSDKKIVLYVIVVEGALLCGYLLNIKQGDWLQFKNVFSLEAMLAFILIGFLAANVVQTTNVEKFYPWLLGGLLMLGVVDCIAIYEVFNHKAWAGTPDSSGAMVYRASSILFNPNLFGFWAALIYLGCSYGIYAFKMHRKMILLGMVLASIAIYFSGSRSSGYLLLGVLVISMLLIKKQFHWLPLITLSLTMLIIYAGAAWLVLPFVSSSVGWLEIALLGERFAATPVQAINYALMKGDFLRSFTNGILGSVPVQIVESIEGRFVGERPDAGWLVLFQDVGWFGLGAVILAVCMLVARGVRICISHPSPSNVYALAVLCYCLIIGFVMRFQIFPVWLFISLVVIVCLVLWRQPEISALRLRN
jgi:hypothetical protein